MTDDKLRFINELIEIAEKLDGRNRRKAEQFRERGKVRLRSIFGPDSVHETKLEEVLFDALRGDASEEERIAGCKGGLDEAITLLLVARDALLGDQIKNHPTNSTGEDTTNKEGAARGARRESVFVVHGHDNEMKQAVARTVEKLECDAIILRECFDRGRTIIEKLTEESRVDFAVVLMSPDDIGYKKPKKGEKAEQRCRPRQNVILELGYFLGILGRDKVAVLVRNDDLEHPSDYSGVMFIAFDDEEAWRTKLAKEMKAAGLDIDLNRL